MPPCHLSTPKYPTKHRAGILCTVHTYIRCNMKSKCVDQTPERKVSLLHPSPAQPFTAPSPRHMGPEMEHEESEEIHQDVKPTPSAPGWREAGMHLPPYLDQIHFREGYKSGLEGRSAFGGNISNQEPSIYPPHTGLFMSWSEEA